LTIKRLVILIIIIGALIYYLLSTSISLHRNKDLSRYEACRFGLIQIKQSILRALDNNVGLDEIYDDKSIICKFMSYNKNNISEISCLKRLNSAVDYACEYNSLKINIIAPSAFEVIAKPNTNTYNTKYNYSDNCHICITESDDFIVPLHKCGKSNIICKHVGKIGKNRK